MDLAYKNTDPLIQKVSLSPSRRDLLRMFLGSILTMVAGGCSSLSRREEVVSLGSARVKDLSSGDAFKVGIQRISRRKRLERLALDIQSSDPSKALEPSLAASVRRDTVERLSAQLRDATEPSELTLGNLGLATITMNRDSERRHTQGTIVIAKLQRNFEFDYQEPEEGPAPIIIVVVPVVLGVLATWGVIVALVTAECTQSAKDVCGEGKVKSVESDIGWFSSKCDIKCK